MDIGCMNPDQRQKYRPRQDGARDQDVADRKDIARQTQYCRSCEATDGSESLIATESLRERIGTDQPETDGGYPRPQDAAGHALDDGSNEGPGKIRPQHEDQQRQSECNSCHSHNRSLRFGCIDHFAGRHLCQQADQSAESQHKANIAGSPATTCQIEGNVRAEPRQQRRKEEVQPVKGKQTFKR